MTSKEFGEMLVKLYDSPQNLNDKELAQLRRSVRLVSDALYRVVQEQLKRGLLKSEHKGSGYAPEIKKRIKDYEI